MEPHDPSPSRRARWTALGLLMLISATNQFHRTSLPAAGGWIQEEFALSQEAMGDLFSAFLFTYTAMMTPGGWLADRAGTKRTLLLVLAGSALFGMATGLAGWIAAAPLAAWWWIAVARGSMGVLSAPIYPSTSRTVASWFPPPEQARANALVIAAAPLGMAASHPAMSWMSRWLGWEAAFAAAGALTLVVLALWARLGRARPEGARGSHGTGPAGAPRARWGQLLRHRGIWLLTLSYATVGYFEYLLFYWIRDYLEEIRGLAENEAALASALPQVAMMVGTPLGGWVSMRLVAGRGLARSLRAVAMASMALAAAFLALAALAGDIAWTLAALSLALGFIGASEGPFWTTAVRLGGPFGATVGGFVNTGGNLLGALAPSVTPRLAAWVNASAWAGGDGSPALGWAVALLAGSAVCLAGVPLWLGVDADRPLAAERQERTIRG